MRGLVTKSTGSWYQVLGPDNVRYECRIKGKFRTHGIKSTNPVAVGDWVEFELEPGQQNGVINELENLSTYPNKPRLLVQTWIRQYSSLHSLHQRHPPDLSTGS